jgi:hypothetical protein
MMQQQGGIMPMVGGGMDPQLSFQMGQPPPILAPLNNVVPSSNEQQQMDVAPDPSTIAGSMDNGNGGGRMMQMQPTFQQSSQYQCESFVRKEKFTNLANKQNGEKVKTVQWFIIDTKTLCKFKFIYEICLIDF